jgi:SAM-dependent methyltransferase
MVLPQVGHASALPTEVEPRNLVTSDTSDTSPRANATLTLTGERTLPGIPDETYWFQRHVVAYRLLHTEASGAVVLDAGCGEGYGLAMLADGGARRVIGADLDPVTVAHARRRYTRPGGVVEVHACELMALPLDDDTVDVTVSFQVIEHLHDVPGYLASLRRVTRPGGRVVIATPNRLTFTPGCDVPVNPFHVREFTAAELVAEVEAAGLAVEGVRGVHHGPVLRSIELLSGASLPETLAAPPDRWPTWIRRVVHRVTPDHFETRDDRVAASLDLIVASRVPPT